MIRLDKYLADLGVGTRNEVKGIIRKGHVLVNGLMVKTPDMKVDEKKDQIVCENRMMQYEQYVYYMMNKPAGVVCATQDNRDETVIDVLCRQIEVTQEVFPVGRLDKDTEGLLILTNDGELSHRLLSPRHHVPKRYEVLCEEAVTEEQVMKLETGVDIGEERLTLPAKVERADSKRIYLTIAEGKFHQVKRMLHAVGNEVEHLKRVQMGTLLLDEHMKSGEARRLTEDEIRSLQEYR